MKKLFAVMLAAVMVLSLLGVTASAEPVEGATNYLASKEWEGTRFPGTIEVSEEDGVKVYTYTAKSPNKWISPTISVYDAVKELIGDADDAEVVFSFEVRGIFKEEGDSTSAKALLRAVNPKNNGFSFPAGTDDDKEWDDEGNYWADLYDELTEGDKLFGISKGNVMKSSMATVEIYDDEWTLVETNPIYISALNLQDSLFKDWVLCMDNIEGYDKEDPTLVSIQVRNAALYNAEDIEEEEEEEEEEVVTTPTVAPADEATPTPTAAPAETETPAPTDDSTSSGGDYTALIIGIACGVVVVAAVVAFILIKKKKDAE